MGKEDRRGKRKLRGQFGNKRVPELGYYYIVTDTDQTEKNYLEGLKSALPSHIRDKIVIKVEYASTSELVAKCRNGASLHPQHSEPWIVFDCDRVVDFDKIIEEAKNSGIHVGWSNPCFEIWLYAYFGEMPTHYDSVSCCKKFAYLYEKKTSQEYKKSFKNLYSKLKQYGDEAKAISIAKQKYNEQIREENSIPSKMFSCTTMHLLIGEIQQKIEEK